jgi:voltage-gated potassium channel
LAKLVLLSGLLLVVASLGFYYAEREFRSQSLFEAFYWAIVTLTTVGYGDVVPTTTTGRVLGMLVMVSGIGLVSTLSGSLASFLVDRKAQKRKGLLKVRLVDHIVILSWNSYATRLIRSLAQQGGQGAQVVLVNELPQDQREELAYELGLENRLHFVFGNPTQKNVVSRAATDTAQAVFILSQAGVEPKDADQQSIYAALTVRSLAPKTPIFGEVLLAENRERLLRAGVNEILPRGEISCALLGYMGANPSIWPFFQHLFGLQGAGLLGFRPLTAEEKTQTWGRLLLEERKQNGGLPLALCRQTKDVSLEDVLDEGSALDKFILELFAASGRQTLLGRSGPAVLVNPADAQALDSYDGLLFLKPGTSA